MRIEFWIDYLCPITYLTHKNLVDAIDELNLKGYDLFYRSFQLNDDELELMKSNKDYLKVMENNNLTIEKFNTTTIHQVAHLAKRKDLAKEFAEEILKDIHIDDNKNVNNERVFEIAKECGMDPNEIKTVIDTQCYTKQINSNKINAKNRGINLVPHIRVNVKNNLFGYQDKETIKKFLIEILRKQPSTEYCGEYCDY